MKCSHLHFCKNFAESFRQVIIGLLIFNLSSCSVNSKKSEFMNDASPAKTSVERASLLNKKLTSSSKLRPYEERELSNGLKLLLVNDVSLPYVSYSLTLRTGSNVDPKDLPGLGNFVADLLDTGTAKKTAPQIATDLSKLASDFGASVASDYTFLSSSCLSEDAEPLLDIFHDLVTQASFSKSEIERKRKELIANAIKSEDNADVFAEKAWVKYLYGDHPYNHTSIGKISSLQKISKKQIIQHYLKYYRPNNASLIIVGKYTPELIRRAESLFGTWQARDLGLVDYPPIEKIEGQKAIIVDKKGLVQAQIRIGSFGIKRSSEDFLSVRIANTILGGAFSSRLVDRVRKELGLTYSISSGFDAKADRGPFEISTFTKLSSVGKTIEETLNVLKKFHTQGVTPEEAEMAKGYLKGIFPTAIETAEKFAHNLTLLKLYGIDDSYLSQYIVNVDRTSTEEINAVIRKYFDEKNIKILVYGPADEIKDQLKDFNPEIRAAADFN